jgi:Lipopolysaccharide kinase (Kdo/WaaP) family
LHRAQIRSNTPTRWRIKDLAGLYFSSRDIGLSKQDELRFLRAYCNRPLAVELKAQKGFWQEVKNRGEKLYREQN